MVMTTEAVVMTIFMRHSRTKQGILRFFVPTCLLS